MIGVFALSLGTWYTWYKGFHRSPYSNRLGPIIMGCGFFIILCGLTNMCEMKGAKNRHFIFGDCYNNIIHNAERGYPSTAKLNLLPTLINSEQASINQWQHDNLIKEQINQTSELKHYIGQQKLEARSNKIDWADRHCKQCAESKRLSRLQESQRNKRKQSGILRQRASDRSINTSGEDEKADNSG